MTREEALRRLHEITAGIDRDESNDDGWWETFTGAEFGKGRLEQLEELIERLTI